MLAKGGHPQGTPDGQKGHGQSAKHALFEVQHQPMVLEAGEYHCMLMANRTGSMWKWSVALHESGHGTAQQVAMHGGRMTMTVALHGSCITVTVALHCSCMTVPVALHDGCMTGAMALHGSCMTVAVAVHTPINIYFSLQTYISRYCSTRKSPCMAVAVTCSGQCIAVHGSISAWQQVTHCLFLFSHHSNTASG
jgi:hypothetical protein